jgi:hypothetical protein
LAQVRLLLLLQVELTQMHLWKLPLMTSSYQED